MMTFWETIKMKMPEGESKQAVLGNGADAEEYVKHLMSFNRFMEKKRYGADLENAANAVLKAGLILMKHIKVPKGKKDQAKADRLTKVKAAKKRAHCSQGSGEHRHVPRIQLLLQINQRRP